MRVGLVGCVKRKQSAPAPAAELYTSDLFHGRRRVVEQTCDRWFILSAKHGLVQPETVLEPYDVAMSHLGVAQRRAWSAAVLDDLTEELGRLADHEFEIHAGADYVDQGLRAGLESAGARTELPTQGLTFGKQLSWYRRQDDGRAGDAQTLPDGKKGRAMNPGSRRGRYAPLTDYLAGRDDRSLTLQFADIERIIGGSLPRSAHDHRPWWANNGNTQAQGWLRAGFEVDAVDLRGEWVRFRQVGS